MNSDFIKLQKHWYGVLQASGFNDIERLLNNGKFGDLLLTGFKLDSKRALSHFENVADFYRFAGQFLHHHKFKTSTEKSIWELYSDGKTYRYIAKVHEISLQKAFRTIKKLINGPFKTYWQKEER